ncbi:MAG TPA: hypothetical protein VFB58_08385 [Chloroflexota bacterium]|nr:hypothetical protein [Chloroflexota bacterium]
MQRPRPNRRRGVVRAVATVVGLVILGLAVLAVVSVVTSAPAKAPGAPTPPAVTPRVTPASTPHATPGKGKHAKKTKKLSLGSPPGDGASTPPGLRTGVIALGVGTGILNGIR